MLHSPKTEWQCIKKASNAALIQYAWPSILHLLFQYRNKVPRSRAITIKNTPLSLCPLSALHFDGLLARSNCISAPCLLHVINLHPLVDWRPDLFLSPGYAAQKLSESQWEREGLKPHRSKPAFQSLSRIDSTVEPWATPTLPNRSQMLWHQLFTV